MDETEFNDTLAAELILEVEAFFSGAIVRCFECEHFVAVELSSQDSVKFTGDDEYQEVYTCNSCRLERKICDLCESEDQEGEVLWSTTDKSKESSSSYDAWICNKCLES